MQKMGSAARLVGPGTKLHKRQGLYMLYNAYFSLILKHVSLKTIAIETPLLASCVEAGRE